MALNCFLLYHNCSTELKNNWFCGNFEQNTQIRRLEAVRDIAIVPSLFQLRVLCLAPFQLEDVWGGGVFLRPIPTSHEFALAPNWVKEMPQQVHADCKGRARPLPLCDAVT